MFTSSGYFNIPRFLHNKTAKSPLRLGHGYRNWYQYWSQCWLINDLGAHHSPRTKIRAVKMVPVLCLCANMQRHWQLTGFDVGHLLSVLGHIQLLQRRRGQFAWSASPWSKKLRETSFRCCVILDRGISRADHMLPSTSFQGASPVPGLY